MTNANQLEFFEQASEFGMVVVSDTDSRARSARIDQRVPYGSNTQLLKSIQA